MGIKEDIRELYLTTIGQDIPLAIMETTEALWSETKRPQLHKKKRTALGWEFAFCLPVGMSYRDFANKEEYYRDSIGDVTTEMLHCGKLAILKVITNKLMKKYLYEWNHVTDRGMILPIPIGYTHAGLYYEDLSAIPHILVAGITRSGKSNFIHTLINSLLYLPRPPRIIVIDLKRLEYGYLSKHVLLVKDGANACKALALLLAEMHNRLITLENSGCVNIQKYNEKGGNMDYVVCVIDELAEISDEKTQDALETLSALSAATGICLVMATQRPDAQTFKHFGRTKSNLLGRLCFKMVDAIGSRIILDNDMGTKIPNIKGRAVWKFNDCKEVQVPYLDPEEAEAVLNGQKQSADRSRARCKSSSNIEIMDSDGFRPTLLTSIPLLQSLSAKVAAIGRKKAD